MKVQLSESVVLPRILSPAMAHIWCWRACVVVVFCWCCSPGWMNCPIMCAAYVCWQVSCLVRSSQLSQAEESDKDGWLESELLVSGLPVSEVWICAPLYLLWRLCILRVMKSPVLPTATKACAKRTGAAASVERRQREPARAISPE